MLHTILAPFAAIFDAMLPPRHTERELSSLTPEALENIATPGGTLPYHTKAVQALVWEVKYRKNQHAIKLAGAFLAERALALAEEEIGKIVLVPVPMHTARRKKRGYNQTEKLCEAVLRETAGSFDYAPHALLRARATPPQQGLPRHKRLHNIKGSMEGGGEIAKVRGRVCIVIDDVATTGATLSEARRVLLSLGAKKVHTLTLAQS